LDIKFNIYFSVSAVLFYFFDVKLFLILPLLIFVFTFLPGVNYNWVFLPMVMFYIVFKNWFSLIGVVLTWAIFRFFLSTKIKDSVMGEKTKINPLIMLLGILGGTAIFGIFGFVVGPLVLVYSLRIIKEVI
jgi:predicted PurR-regulated permease PerM